MFESNPEIVFSGNGNHPTHQLKKTKAFEIKSLPRLHRD